MKSADLAGKLHHNGDFINLVLLLMFWPGCTMTSACHEPHFHILNDIFRKTSPFYLFEPFLLMMGETCSFFAYFGDIHPNSWSYFNISTTKSMSNIKDLCWRGFLRKECIISDGLQQSRHSHVKNLYWMTECPIGAGARERLALNMFSPDLVFSCSFKRT